MIYLIYHINYHLSIDVVGVLRIELRPYAPKAYILPLYYTPKLVYYEFIRTCNIKIKILNCKIGFI